ncbi:MAG: lysoplasmalogenase [Mogibacterium sp.]|nr:lysoplasmalogenase [Mogibacterium sp.]
MKTIVLILFFIATGIHLYASWNKDKPLRNKSKPFILLLLLAYYCLSAEQIAWMVVLALLFSWIGDVLLIPPGVKWFTAGGISFMVSHFFFILSYAALTDFSKVNGALTVILPVLFIIATFITFKYLRPFLPKGLFYPMLLYLLINGGMNCFAWFRSMSTAGVAAILTAIGALLFYVSDTSLFFVRFNKNSRLKTHFLVMLTYSIGEFLIVQGLIMK